ncbi:MAG: gamma carbonic anhydrase family protein [Calditrichaeota bacterium]|nr:gamma carbonic anhydrase family protein [Calditrichota bacterium]MCB9391091.1 gamma carbonic anhydrase family protein [Calditrichota bacterium]
MILPYNGVEPDLHPSAWLAETAVVIGDTHIGAESSVWYGTVVRGDVNWIRIGAKVNLQDGVICHVTIARAPLLIEDLVSVGHGAIVHGCSLKRGCLIGIGARVLDLATVGEGSLIAAGSVVLEKTIIPPGELWAGVPAEKKRELSAEEQQGLLDTAERYVQYRLHYQGMEAEIPGHRLPKK